MTTYTPKTSQEQRESMIRGDITDMADDLASCESCLREALEEVERLKEAMSVCTWCGWQKTKCMCGEDVSKLKQAEQAWLAS